MWEQNSLSQPVKPISTTCGEYLASAVNQLSNSEFQTFLDRLRRSIPTRHCSEVLDSDTEDNPVEKLTGRESEVLTLVASGYSRKEIGAALAISENTAACHISSIYRKLDVRTIAEATVLALRSGVI